MLHAFSVDVSDDGNGRDVHLSVHGEIDLSVAPQLLGAIERAARSFDHHLIVVDLRDVSFMDSEGLAALVAAHRNLVGKGSHLVVSNPSAMIARLLEATGIDSYVDVRYRRRALHGSAGRPVLRR
ncbi:MAG: STAS domain-containing protein [Acidimicrobiales bacterium]